MEQIDFNLIVPPVICHEAEVQKEIEQILIDTAEQIKRRTNDSNDVVAILKSYCPGGKIYGNTDIIGKTILYYNDSLLKAIPYIKESGRFVWQNCDYQGQYSYWITERNVCPHSWFSKI